MIYNYTNKANQRTKLSAHLAENQYARVVDVGGVLDPWNREFVTHYIDLMELDYVKVNSPSLWDEHMERATGFIADIGNPRTWGPVLEDVEKNGKFDFLICCHVMEHVLDPSFALEFLASVAHKGFVSMPCKYVELEWGNQFGEEGLKRCGVNGRWRGCHCHRWIVSLKDDCIEPTLWFWPKLNFIEYLDGIDEWAEPIMAITGENRVGDLSLWFEGEIPFCIVSDDFLLDDVNPENACELYRRGLKEGL
jgi:hypothetical protein